LISIVSFFSSIFLVGALRFADPVFVAKVSDAFADEGGSDVAAFGLGGADPVFFSEDIFV
jgi:hypothetical protein